MKSNLLYKKVHIGRQLAFRVHGLFPDFDFGDADDEDDIFLDVSQVVNDSLQSSY